jgi:hypothetical protein
MFPNYGSSCLRGPSQIPDVHCKVFNAHECVSIATCRPTENGAAIDIICEFFREQLARGGKINEAMLFQARKSLLSAEDTTTVTKGKSVAIAMALGE